MSTFQSPSDPIIRYSYSLFVLIKSIARISGSEVIYSLYFLSPNALETDNSP